MGHVADRPGHDRRYAIDATRIERELGQGGMATVYLAEDVRHRRKVALKVLHPELSAVLGPERFLKEIELTASEYKLLTTLTRYPGRVYSRMELVEKVLGYDFEGYERAIDSHVKNLRAKLADDPKEPRFIHTVFGVGYRFDPPQAAS